jgi:hypothetical protein
VETYRRIWRRATRTVVVVGCVVPLVAWCVVSPWTFAPALAAACWGRGLAVRTACSPVGRRVRHRFAGTPLVEDREWQLLRLLPALALAAVGWSMLLGAAGLALLLVDAVFGVPLLAGDRQDRWPDGHDVGRVPDTVEELTPVAVVEVVEVVESREVALPAPREESFGAPSVGPAASWPGPRTLLPDLDDDELLHAWESSTRALGLRPGPAALLRIVTARAHYLDALAERDPDGVARRLALGERDDWTSFDPPA